MKFLNVKKIEVIIIILFLTCMLFVKAGQLLDHKIIHDYPISFRANDNFFNSMIPNEIKESGEYSYFPNYVASGYEDVVAYIPPLLYHLSAMFSFLSSIETYDCTYIVAIFLFCATCIIFYLTIKKTNREIALLSLPFMIGIFSFPFEIAQQWGLWMFLAGNLFLVSVVWSLSQIEQKYGFLLLGLFLSATAISHFSELIFVIGFTIFYYLLLFVKKSKITKTEIKNILIGFGIFLLISTYYIIITYFTYLQVNTLNFQNVEFPGFAPNFGVNFNNFGINQLLLFAGVIIFAGVVFYEKDIKEILPEIKIPSISLFLGIFMLLVGFTNYIGFNRAFQTRILWPIYLSVFMGLCVYFAIGFLRKWKYSLTVIISLLLILVFTQTHIGMTESGGIITKGIWDGFTWLGVNTEIDSKVMHFYSSTITQELSLMSSRRIPYKIDIEEYTKALNDRVIKNDYKAILVCLTDMKLPYRKSLFSYGYHLDEEDYKKGSVLSMWDMNYYLIAVNTPDNNQNLILYNRYMAQYLLNQTWIETAYANNEIVILKNKEPGRKP
jgi:hypothetical protein